MIRVKLYCLIQLLLSSSSSWVLISTMSDRHEDANRSIDECLPSPSHLIYYKSSSSSSSSSSCSLSWNDSSSSSSSSSSFSSSLPISSSLNDSPKLYDDNERIRPFHVSSSLACGYNFPITNWVIRKINKKKAKAKLKARKKVHSFSKSCSSSHRVHHFPTLTNLQRINQRGDGVGPAANSTGDRRGSSSKWISTLVKPRSKSASSKTSKELELESALEHLQQLALTLPECSTFKCYCKRDRPG